MRVDVLTFYTIIRTLESLLYVRNGPLVGHRDNTSDHGNAGGVTSLNLLEEKQFNAHANRREQR